MSEQEKCKCEKLSDCAFSGSKATPFWCKKEEFVKKSTITWHKYPSEKPQLDKQLLLWDGIRVFQGWYEYYGSADIEYRFETALRFPFRNALNEIKRWAYMPEGPQ